MVHTTQASSSLIGARLSVLLLAACSIDSWLAGGDVMCGGTLLSIGAQLKCAWYC